MSEQLLYLIVVCYNEQSWEYHAIRGIIGPSFSLARDKNARPLGPSGTERNTRIRKP